MSKEKQMIDVNALEKELKSCPCCDGKAQIRYTGDGSGPYGYTSNVFMRSKPGFVLCLKCGLSTQKYTRVCRAIEAWNRRCSDDSN